MVASDDFGNISSRFGSASVCLAGMEAFAVQATILQMFVSLFSKISLNFCFKTRGILMREKEYNVLSATIVCPECDSIQISEFSLTLLLCHVCAEYEKL